MAAGIEEIDAGYVHGTTWHNMPNYVQQDFPVTIAQCKEVFDYEMKVVPSYGKYIDKNGHKVTYAIPGANHVVRPDTQTIIAPSIGSKFTIIDQEEFVNWVDNAVLKAHPDITIESCGTLFSGSGQFISVAIDKYHIHGDESEQINRILYHHRIGVSAYSYCLNTVRVVCDNTRRLAQNTSAIMAFFKHTAGAGDKIKAGILDLVEAKSAFAVDKEKMDFMARMDFSVEDVNAVLEGLWSTEGKEGRSLTIAQNKHKKVKDVFEGGQNGFLKGYDKTAYAFLNSLTDVLGNENIKGDGNIGLDNIVGQRAGIKEKAEELILARA